jgi:hypothetical protein
MKMLAEVLRAGAMPKLKPKALNIMFNPASKQAHEDVMNAVKQRKLRDT